MSYYRGKLPACGSPLNLALDELLEFDLKAVITVEIALDEEDRDSVGQDQHISELCLESLLAEGVEEIIYGLALHQNPNVALAIEQIVALWQRYLAGAKRLSYGFWFVHVCDNHYFFLLCRSLYALAHLAIS